MWYFNRRSTSVSLETYLPSPPPPLRLHRFTSPERLWLAKNIGSLTRPIGCQNKQIATKAPLTFSRAAYTHFPWNLIGSSWPVLSFWSADAFTLVLWPSWTFSLFIHTSFWKDQIRFHWRISFPDICRILEFLPRDLGKALSGHVITTV